MASGRTRAAVKGSGWPSVGSACGGRTVRYRVRAAQDMVDKTAANKTHPRNARDIIVFITPPVLSVDYCRAIGTLAGGSCRKRAPYRQASYRSPCVLPQSDAR